MHIRLHINLLGGFQLTYNGEPVDTVDTLRIQELLAYLLLHRDTQLSRRYLAFLFWSESTEKQAFSNFRNLLHLLRNALPDSDQYVHITRKFIKWNEDASYFLDIEEFEYLVKKAKIESDASQKIIFLKKALECYQGSLLPSCYSQWIEQPRQQLTQKYESALKNLVNILKANDRLEEAIQFAEKRIQCNNLNEAAWRSLIQLHGENNNQAAAIQTFNQCTNILKEELDIEPSIETKKVSQKILSQNSTSTYDLNSYKKPDNNKRFTPESKLVFGNKSNVADKFIFHIFHHPILKYVGIILVLGLLFAIGYYTTLESSDSVQSIAILPLDDLSNGPEQEYFAIGMTDELNNYLSQIPSLSVISRNSAMKFNDTSLAIPEIASSLDVKWILTGSVYHDDNDVRVSLQLVDASSDKNVWSKSYKRKVSDIIFLQSDVARDVTKEISATLNPKQKQRLAASSKIDPELYHKYLKAKYHFSRVNQSRTLEAISILKNIIKEDSTYAPAFALLGRSYHQLISIAPFESDSIYPEAERFAKTAIELNPNLDEPYFTLGWILAVYHWKWEEGILEFKNGLNLNRNSQYGIFQYSTLMGALGYNEEAISMAERLLEIDPASPLSIRQLSLIYYFNRDYDKAIKIAREALALEPGFMPAHFVLGLAYLEIGELSKSLEALKKMYDYNPNPVSKSILAFAYARADSIEQAEKILQELEALNVSRFLINRARIYVALNDKNSAIRLLNEAVNRKAYGLFTLPSEATWDPLRSDSRFKKIMQRINLR